MVTTDVNTVTYNGDGSTTAFPFTFKIQDASEINLQLVQDDDTVTEITSDFYVDAVNSTVHYPGYAPGAEPPEADQPPKVQTGQKLTIWRDVPMTQENDLGDKWPFHEIEDGLDKLTMIAQQIYSYTNRKLDAALASMFQLAGIVTDSGKLQHITDQYNAIDANAAIASTAATTATNKAAAAATSATNAANSASSAQTTATALTNFLETKETLTAPAVDTTLAINGAAADAKVTGDKVTHLLAIDTQIEKGWGIFTNLVRGGLDNTTGDLTPANTNSVSSSEWNDYDYPVEIKVASGYEYLVSYKNKTTGVVTYSSYYTDTSASCIVSPTFYFKIKILTNPVTYVTADVDLFSRQVTYKLSNTYISQVNAMRCEKLENGTELLDGIMRRGMWNSSGYLSYYLYRVTTRNIVQYDKDIKIVANNGFRFTVLTYNNDDTYKESSGWQTDYSIPANQKFTVYIGRTTEDSTEIADVMYFWSQISVVETGGGNTEPLAKKLNNELSKLKTGNDDLNVEYVNGSLTNTGTVATYNRFRICSKNILEFDKPIIFSVASGYRFQFALFDSAGTYETTTGWYTGWYIPANRKFRVSVQKYPEDTSVVADIDTFADAISTDSPLAQTDYVVDDVNNDGNVYIAWEVGSLTGAGQDDNVTNRMRSDYVAVNKGTIVTRTGGQISVNEYDASKKMLSAGSWGYTPYEVQNDGYIRIVYTKTPVDTITESEIPTLAQNVQIHRVIPSAFNGMPLTREEFEQNSFIPPYFYPQIKSNKTKLTELIATAGFDGDNFVFITDVHWNANAKHSPMLIRKSCNDLNIDKVLCGGDIIGGNNPHAKNMEESAKVVSAFKNNYTVPFYVAYGNHDGPTYVPVEECMTYDEFYALDQKQVDNKMVYNKTDYCFYFDNPACLTRYIFLNTTENGGISQTQMDWIASTLANLPANYKVIFVAHIVVVPIGSTPLGRDESYYQLTTSMNALLPTLDTFNDTHTDEKVVAFFTGHTHIDGIFHSPKGIPLIMTDCDAQNTGMTVDGTNPNYTLGTITEQCFDNVVVDYGHDVINCVRTGRGRNRKVHTAIVAVSPTATLTTDLTDAVWTSENETIATVTDGVVSAVSIGVTKITAKTDDDLEAWMVSVE